MTNYTFEPLSPAEFEILCRDLLQKELNITLDNFMSGRDQGIDLRYSRDPRQTIIVQCKRYLTTYSQLKRELTEEAKKVKGLKPKRYILMTSLPLSPLRKKAIQKLFAPYIQSPDDIYGKENINNLLGKFPEIEKQHYKLWFSSVNILNKILHSDIVNKTRLEEEDIRKTVSIFAENESYPRAMEVFKESGFVVISGAPGVGKTTLARMLIFKMMAEEKYQQFIFVSRDINEAFSLLEDDTSQLFFFDDFLGRSYFEKNLERNEETDLVRFIDKIVRSKNKALILTTREYILQQAQSQYSDLKSKSVEHNKYVIDLGSYTKKVKASILYNHLHNAGLPGEYIIKLLDDQSYKTLINHRNYNPRLIESILKEEPWKEVEINNFSQTLISYFDDPLKIWKDVFENGISANAKTVLKIMFTMETSISYDCLYNLFEKNLRYLQRAYDYHDFESALKELDGTFITTYKVEDSIKVSYQNPSIFDFLFSYYSKERRDDLVPIIQNALYLDQIVHRFTAINPTFKLGRIQVTPKLLDVIAQKIIEGLDKLPWSEESVSASKRHIFSFRNTPKFTQVLDTLLFTLDLKENSTLRSYLLQQFIKENSVFAAKNAETYSQIDLLKYFVEELDDEQRAEAIDKAARSICSYEDVDYFLGLEDEADLAESFAEWMADNSLSEITTEIVAEEICNLDSDIHKKYDSSP